MNWREMSDELPMLVVLFIITGTGIAISLWLGRIPEAELTAAYINLIEVADWMIKASLGAILVLTGAGRLRSRNGGGGAE